MGPTPLISRKSFMLESSSWPTVSIPNSLRASYLAVGNNISRIDLLKAESVSLKDCPFNRLRASLTVSPAYLGLQFFRSDLFISGCPSSLHPAFNTEFSNATVPFFRADSLPMRAARKDSPTDTKPMFESFFLPAAEMGRNSRGASRSCCLGVFSNGKFPV